MNYDLTAIPIGARDVKTGKPVLPAGAKLVERLRGSPRLHEIREAADRIEALEAALREIARLSSSTMDTAFRLGQVEDIARAALSSTPGR